jgi:hypothetical protein
MLFEIVADIIEIPEEDYKKNDVYRPWPAAEGGKTVDRAELENTTRNQRHLVLVAEGSAKPG